MSLLAALIDHIYSRREAMIAACLRHLRGSSEFGAHEAMSSPQLIDHLPQLLADLTQYLRGSGEAQAKDDARSHGQVRWEQDFRLDQILREVLVMRAIVIQEIELYAAKQGGTISATVTWEVQRQVGRFFDQVLLDSAAQFSEQEKKQTQQDRRLIGAAQKSEIEAVDAARNRLLRIIAHELRNELNAANLIATTVFAEHDAQSQAESQEILRRSHRRMTTLVNQMLEMAPLLAGREPLQLGQLDVAAFAREQCRLFTQMAAAKKLKLDCEVIGALDTVVTDTTKVQRIITNLVQNALKYTPSGGTVKLQFEPLDAARWQLSVSDTGPGIPLEHRTKIFEEFHRVPESQDQEGAGLGLAIVRQLVDVLHGEIILESELGHGSRFCIKLPRDATATA
jgi:signal transduction histidine kinase